MRCEYSQAARPRILQPQRLAEQAKVSGGDDNVRRFVRNRGLVFRGNLRYLLCFRTRRHRTAWTEKCHWECRVVWRFTNKQEAAAMRNVMFAAFPTSKRAALANKSAASSLSTYLFVKE